MIVVSNYNNGKKGGKVRVRCNISIKDKQKAEDEYLSMKNKVSETSEFTCGRCKRNKTTRCTRRERFC